jgi:N-acetyl-beta-hexosaminidase
MHRVTNQPNPIPDSRYSSGDASKAVTEVELTAQSRVLFSDPSLATRAAVVSDNIFLITGMRLADSSAPPVEMDVTLVLNSSLQEEEHQLIVNSTGVFLVGGSPVAVSWAIATMGQIVCYNYMNRVALPALMVHDWPDVSFRGLLVDVARALVVSADLFAAVDYCALLKLNVLHLHLGDDHACASPSAFA